MKFWKFINLRKVVNLFKRSDTDDNDRRRGGLHEDLFPLLPSVPVIPPPVSQAVPQAASAIITKLLERTRVTAARPVLSSHTITITTPASTEPAKQLPAGRHNTITLTEVENEPRTQGTSSTIIAPEVEPELDCQTDVPAVDAKLEPESVDPAAAAVVEIDEELQEREIAPDVRAEKAEIASILDHADKISGDTDAGSLAQDIDQELHEGETTSSLPSLPASESETELKDDDISPLAAEYDTEISESTATPANGLVQDDEDIDAGPTDAIPVAGQIDTEEEQVPAISDSSSDSSSDEEAFDAENGRADWAPIMAIPEDSFRETLLQHLPAAHNLTIDSIQCTEKFQGGYNFVRILEVVDGPSADRYIIKVPCVGTSARWQASDAYMLRNDARTMLYIRKHTDIPSPEVLGWSDQLDSTLGAPYILMRANKGIPASRIWFERDADGDEDIENASLPDKPRMAIRLTFLRSLAAQMAKLQALSFAAAGTLDFDADPDNPSIGPTYHWKTLSELEQLSDADMGTPASTSAVPAFTSSTAYFSTALDATWPLRTDSASAISNGRRLIMRTILSFPPFTHPSARTARESFSLRHPDLDFQNILCAPSGHVTGIIDWDAARAAPRCLGFAALPAFLIRDWAPEYEIDAAVHTPWDLAEYRAVYARAMLACAVDGRYTLKSAVYEACNAAVYGGSLGGSVGGFVRKVLGDMEGTRRLEQVDVLRHLGEGWGLGEMRIAKELRGLVAPVDRVEAVEPWVWVDPDGEEVGGV